jgi:hypothetical protein
MTSGRASQTDVAPVNYSKLLFEDLAILPKVTTRDFNFDVTQYDLNKLDKSSLLSMVICRSRTTQHDEAALS